ncbi:efflux RND transporter periplasmic adaptor subunit [Spirosoma gilvum]
MKTSYLNSYLVALSLVVTACHQSKPAPKIMTDEKIPVKLVALKPQRLQQTIHAAGQFTTDDETFLSFKTGGIIKQVFVKEGDAVRKGQLVATLNLHEINAQLQQTKLAYEKSLRDYNRASHLYRDSVATLEQVQNAKTALDISQQQLATIQFNQTYSEIRATASGYVLKKLANPGQLVNAGDPVLQLNGAHQSAWVLNVGVSDAEWGAIQIGNTAIIQTDAFPDKSFKAVVSRKTEGIDPATGTFTIQLQLAGNVAGRVASGLFGKAVIYPSTKVASWAVPYDALLDGDAGEAYVFISNDDKTALKVAVKVGSINAGKATILTGLEGAKALIVTGSAYLKEGAAIKIIN